MNSTQLTEDMPVVPDISDVPTLPNPLYVELSRRAAEEQITDDYPDFDPITALDDPALGPLLRGERPPALRELYEATHMDAILEARIAAAVETALVEAERRLAAEADAAREAAVAEAVSAAVREQEGRLLAHIRARGCRPAENGTASSTISLRPAADRLTRRERAMLAERAERGETVEL